MLKLDLASWQVMHGKQPVQLVQPMRKKKADKEAKADKASPSRADVDSWEGVDRGLFEVLKQWRYDLAKQQGKPPYIIFSDATLRELARVRPSTSAQLLLVYGIGQRKVEDFGTPLLERILEYCTNHGVAMDVPMEPVALSRPAKAAVMNASRALALKLFSEGSAIDDVIHQTQRSRSTVIDYLCDFIARDQPASIAAWIAPDLYQRIAAAVEQHGSGRLKPLFIALQEKVPYEDIRVVVTHLTRDQGLADDGTAAPP